MSRLLPKLMIVVGIGITGAACQDNSYGAPNGYYQPAPVYGASRYGGYAPAPQYGYPQNGYPQTASYYNQGDGRRYTTVTVTNRGQNGYRDDVVQQQVVCGSQYYDGYRTRTAPRC